MDPAVNRNESSTTGDERVTVLTFDLEETRYCVRAESVASVLSVADETPLLDADDPWNAGSLSAAGERVRVVDLPRVFGAARHTAARTDEPKLLVFTTTDDDGDYYGWLVDDVDVTSRVRATALEPTRTNTRHVKGRLEIDGDEVVWLDEGTIHGDDNEAD